MDVVSQIGLGYTFLFLLWGQPRWRARCGRPAVILFGYWLLFALYPLPAADFDYATVGVRRNWQHLTGLPALGQGHQCRRRISTSGS